MKLFKQLASGAGLLSLLSCGDKDVFFKGVVNEDQIVVQATKDGKNVHLKVYDWPILNTFFGAERDYEVEFDDNLFEYLNKVGEGDYTLEEYTEDPGLFSWEINYFNKNSRDKGVIRMVRWQVKDILNNVFDKIRNEHIDP